MSRRRPAPPPAPGVVRQYTLKVICTHGGPPPGTVLHHLADMRGHEYDQAFMALEGRNGSPVSAWREDGAVRYRFKCPRCPNDKQLREENLVTVYDGLSQLKGGSGHPVLDINALP